MTTVHQRLDLPIGRSSREPSPPYHLTVLDTAGRQYCRHSRAFPVVISQPSWVTTSVRGTF